MDFTIFQQAINNAQTLIETSQSNEYLIDFPYSTFTIPRPGERQNEPGRQNFRHTLNNQNRQIVTDFVQKHQLDFNADPEKVFLPKLKECLIADFGKEKFNEAENNHRQKWRLVESIGSFINQTMTWAIDLIDFVNNPSEINKERILELIANIDSVVISPDNETGEMVANETGEIVANINQPEVCNRKSQDVLDQFRNQNHTVMQMINASAGSDANLEAGGGTFGDPVHSLTAQEEDLYRTFPFHIKFFVQFILSRYVDAITSQGKVSRFVYLDKYAPKDGKCLILQNGKQFYLFSAANDNTKVQMTNDQQTTLFKKVFNTAFNVMIKKKIDTFIAGAFGIGIFKGNANSLAEAVSYVHKKYSDSQSNQKCNVMFAYYIRNPKDETGIANFNILANKFGSPNY